MTQATTAAPAQTSTCINVAQLFNATAGLIGWPAAGCRPFEDAAELVEYVNVRS